MASDGYAVVTINNVQFKAHRICFALASGGTDFDTIDHINGDRGDNRLCNLRPCTPSQNSKNRKQSKSNSGFSGVRLRRGKYEAYIGSGSGRYIGTYQDIADAITARVSAETTLQYTVRR